MHRSSNVLRHLLILGTLTSTAWAPSAGFGKEDPQSERARANVIYGDDNRRDLYSETDPALLDVARSTVALIRKSVLKSSGSLFEIQGTSYRSSYGLCSTEPFVEQSTAAFCSGFLIAPDLIATAGHCIRTTSDCTNTSFVFDFAYRTANTPPETAAKDDVYTCKRVIRSTVESVGSDFAVVQLDRPVTGRNPLRIRQSGQVNLNDPLVVIGHPAGLPTKIADGAYVRSNTATGYFTANLDTYGGNSGSAVFNEDTLEVEGILVRGEVDFVRTSANCSVSNACKDTGCRGEDVTRITEILPYIGTTSPFTSL